MPWRASCYGASAAPRSTRRSATLDGERKIGPSLLGILGTNVELDDGSALLIDDDYLAESILEPQAKLVAGYGEAVMPSYQGLVSDADVAALVEYIKSLD